MTSVCAWCQRPATQTVEVEPPQYKTVIKLTGDGQRLPAKQLVKAAITALACERCAERVTEPSTPPRPRQPRKPGADQTTIFDLL